MPAAPFELELDTRFRDIDAMGHVNNAVYATFIEHGRVSYLKQVAGVDPEAVGIVIANLEIEYRRPIEFGETVTLRVTVPEIGGTSLRFDVEILVDGDLAAESTSRLVHVDRESGESTPIPDEWRDRIATLEGH